MDAKPEAETGVREVDGYAIYILPVTRLLLVNRCSSPLKVGFRWCFVEAQIPNSWLELCCLVKVTDWNQLTYVTYSINRFLKVGG